MHILDLIFWIVLVKIVWRDGRDPEGFIYALIMTIGYIIIFVVIDYNVIDVVDFIKTIRL